MATARLLVPLLLALLAHSPRWADGFAASNKGGRAFAQRVKRESPKAEFSFDKLGQQMHDLFSSIPSLSKPSFDDISKLGERFGGLGHGMGSFHGGSTLAASSDGHGVIAHEEVSQETGSKRHRTTGAYFFDPKGGVSGFSCYDEKCKKDRLKDRRRRSATEQKGFPSGKVLQNEILSNVLNTLQALSERLQELQNRLAQTLQEAMNTHYPVGRPPTSHVPESSSHYSGAAAGGSVITGGGGSPIQGEFHGSSISSSSSPGLGTVISHKEVVDRVGSAPHSSSGTYVVNPHGEVSGVSCTDGKCHKVGDKGGGQASGPSQAGAAAPQVDHAGPPLGNRPEAHYSSSSFAVDPSGHVSGVACVDGKCKTTGDEKGRDRKL